MAARRALPWLLLLMTRLDSSTCSSFTNISTLSTSPADVGNSLVPDHFHTTSPPHEYHEEDDFTDKYFTNAGNMSHTTKLETTPSVSLRSRQMKTTEEVSVNDAVGDCFGTSGTETDISTQEATEFIPNPNERITLTALDCSEWDELTKFFRYNNTLVLYSSTLKTNFEGVAFFCRINVNVPQGLNVKTEIECVGLWCCVYPEALIESVLPERCFRHDVYGNPWRETTLFHPASFGISLDRSKSSQPFYVHLSIAAYQFPSFSPDDWEVGCVSPTQGKYDWKSLS